LIEEEIQLPAPSGSDKEVKRLKEGIDNYRQLDAQTHAKKKSRGCKGPALIDKARDKSYHLSTMADILCSLNIRGTVSSRPLGLSHVHSRLCQ
jgi:hypothetical protein